VKTSLKYLSFLIIPLIQINICLAQKDVQTSVTTNKKAIGNNLITQQALNAIEYTFTDRIHEFKVDTLNNYVTIKLRGLSKNGKWLDNTGSVVRYSIRDNKVLWAKKINYQSEDLDDYRGVTLYTSPIKSYNMDGETGAQLWEVKNSLLYTFKKLNLAIGYKLKASKKEENMLEGISLKDGTALWQRRINREYSWNGVDLLDDTTLIVAAAGLHTISLKNGQGWDYDAKTGQSDYTNTAIGAGLGIASALLTGMYSVPTGHNTLINIASNILTDSTAVYFASKEALAKLDKKGNILWKAALPETETGKSLIFKKTGNLILISSGYAYIGQRKVNIGRPLIASFNINTGQSKFITFISAEKGSLLDYRVAGDTVFAVFKDRVEKYAIEDGKLLATQKYNLDKNDELSYFIGNQIFTKKDSSYVSLASQSAHTFYIATKNKAIIIGHNLNAKGDVGFDDLYIAHVITKDLTFINKQKHTIVVDKAGKELADISVAGKSVLLNNKLYTATENSFLEIDVADLRH
jgi:hypothetical protein